MKKMKNLTKQIHYSYANFKYLNNRTLVSPCHAVTFTIKSIYFRLGCRCAAVPAHKAYIALTALLASNPPSHPFYSPFGEVGYFFPGGGGGGEGGYSDIFIHT